MPRIIYRYLFRRMPLLSLVLAVVRSSNLAIVHEKGSDEHPNQTPRELTYQNGEYFGHVHPQTGKREGWGVFRWNPDSKKKKYEGYWKNDQRHGMGTTTYMNGAHYRGDFEHDQAHGRGVYVWPDGSRYQGDFQNGKFHGQGIFKAVTGGTYQGEYRNDQRNGYGVALMPYGDRYEGYFLNDKYHGKGVYTWADGRQYKGDFEYSKLSGNGVMMYPNGDRKEGEWRDDALQQGSATCIDSSGRRRHDGSCSSALDVQVACKEEVCTVHVK